MKFTYNIKRHCKTHGGLFCGVQFYFPVTVCDDNDHYLLSDTISLAIGLVVVTVNIHVYYNKRRETDIYEESNKNI